MEWNQRIANQLRIYQALLQKFHSWANNELDRQQLGKEIKELDESINWLATRIRTPDAQALANYNPPAWSPKETGK